MNYAILKPIKLLLLDVDGVLTNGQIIYDSNGGELKCFNVCDGLGIRLLMRAGIEVGVITGRVSDVVRHRCANLGITIIYQGVKDKRKAFNEILAEGRFCKEETAYMGDDLIDIPLLDNVGVPIAVANAHELVKQRSALTTSRPGGDGGVRDVCEWILKAKGLWE